MRLNVLCRSILLSLLVVLSLPGCRSKSKGATEESADNPAALVEQNDASQLVFAAEPNGQVKLLVKGTDGKPVEGVTGTLSVKGEDPKAPSTKVALTPDPKSGMLVAALPEFADDLTEVKYNLNVNNKPIKGTMHVPSGGTRELEENAKVVAEAKIAPGTKGPNGGVVQVVGDDVVEIVAGQKNGTVRAYMLDKDLKPIKAGQRQVKLGLVSEKGSETVVLAPAPDGQFLVGKMTIIANPIKITVAVTYQDHTDVVLCNHFPGQVIVVGPSAPVIIILANVVWDVDVVVLPPPVIMVHGKGKGRGWAWGRHKKWKH